MHWKILALWIAIAVSAVAQNVKHPFTFEDMMKVKRVGAPVPSPDGKWVVFAAEDVDLEANTKTSHLWIVPASGGPAAAGRRLNETPNHEERPRFSPDGKRVIWTSKATEPTQIWMSELDTESGVLKDKPHQVTNISTGADGGIWSPDGKNIVFVSAVYPDCNPPAPGSGATSADDCNKQRDEELKKSKVKAKIFTRLFYRHWNALTEFKRSHLFVISADATVEAGASPAPPAGSQPARLPPQKTGREPRDLHRVITTCRRSISAVRICMRFRPTARSWLTRATSTKSKRPAPITKFSSCRSLAARQRKFPPVPAAIRRRSILGTETKSHGDPSNVADLKPINGD